MARRGSSAKADEATASEATNTEEVAAEAASEAQADTTSPEATEAANDAKASDDNAGDAELTDEQIAELAKPFIEAAQRLVEQRDEATGDPTAEAIDELNKVYTDLDGGVKVKNAAKKSLNELMKEAMKAKNITLARAYMEFGENLKASASKKAGKTSTPREPVNPTEAFAERVATLSLAYGLAVGNPIEGLDEDWQDKATALAQSFDSDEIDGYRAWFVSEDEDKGDAPEVSPVIVAAVKLSLGRSAKPGKAVKRKTEGGSTQTYEGPRRDIAKHIAEAFADKAEGDFLKVGEIRKFKSTEYGDDHPSAGAISIRLFPKAGKCNVAGVTPDTDAQGNKGARKAAAA